VPPGLTDGDGHAPCGFRELCSAGLAFKLAHALVKRGRESGLTAAASCDIRPLLELVALGTIADLVPLTGENRILVSAGLERLNHTNRPGLVSLKRGAQCAAELGTFEVGFQLAPRLNAAGRLETAEEALLLLLTRDSAEADQLAASLCARNRERQEIERSIAEQAIECVRARFKPEEDFVIVEGQSPWHIGVVGIVASRVLQQFNRPTIIMGGDGPQLRGSGRSIDGFDLAVALRECGDLLLRHGGHAMAAGISMMPEKLDEFRQRLNGIARQWLTPERLQRPLHLDAKLTLDQLHVPTLLELAQLKPTGQGNPPLQFQASGLTHSRVPQRIGADKQHAKMWVTDGTATHEALWWRVGTEPLPDGKFDLAFTPAINEYNGSRRVQLKVLDWRPSRPPEGPLKF
jgi:single-stranded-DNA-specific exonuclease